ncbi:hypothetical protein IJ670_03840, partial [bacterium]|nr:hypothetical protein [bacterium]
KNICAFTNFIQDNIDKIRNAKFDKTRIMNILSVFVEYYKEIKISTNPYLWMEIAGIEASREKSQQCIAPVTTKNVEFQKPLKEQPIQPNRAVISEMPLQKEPVIKEKEIQPAQVQNVPSPSIPPQTPSNVSQNVSSGNDESSIWQDVISRISSTPARAFFSGVAKLISVKEGKITLGFLHENALAQAKSPSKLNQLQLAISGLATKYEVEMIKIDSSTKTIETTAKPKAKPTNIPRPTPLKEQIEPSKVQDNEADLQENSKTKQQYSEQVQDMLEQFNGRIIE